MINLDVRQDSRFLQNDNESDNDYISRVQSYLELGSKTHQVTIKLPGIIHTAEVIVNVTKQEN